MATVRSEFTDDEWKALSAEDRAMMLDIDAQGEPEEPADGEFEGLPYDVVLDPDGHPI